MKIPGLKRAFFSIALSALFAILIACPSIAQDDNFTPFVISADEVVHRMLRMADVGPNDYLIDLGSGDGRIPIAAAKRYGTRGLGVDLDPPLVELARKNAVAEGVSGKVRFEVKDLFETDLSQATVVAFYLLPNVAMELRPKLLKELRPGTRIVAHDYDLGDWLPDEWTSIRVPLGAVNSRAPPAKPASSVRMRIVPGPSGAPFWMRMRRPWPDRTATSGLSAG